MARALQGQLTTALDVPLPLKQGYGEMIFLEEWFRVIKSDVGSFRENACLAFPKKGVLFLAQKRTPQEFNHPIFGTRTRL